MTYMCTEEEIRDMILETLNNILDLKLSQEG
jgi:hypothetical protein